MRNKRPHKRIKKRVGRGSGSGHGKTSCRGHKGQMSRSGSNRTPGFEGGQMTFIRRIPKRGFNQTRFKAKIEVINLSVLNALGEKEITPDVLRTHGVLKGRFDGVKILSEGTLDKAISVHAHYFSQKAKEKIEQAGGKTAIIEQGNK